MNTYSEEPISAGEKGLSYLQQYYANHNQADLDLAISLLTGSISSMQRGAFYAHFDLGNLASAFRARFHLTGDVDDLARAIEYYTNALAHAPLKSPYLPHLLNNFGNARICQYKLSFELTDLQQAINLFMEAIRLVGLQPELYNRFTAGLAMSWKLYYDHTGDPEFLDSSIRILQPLVERIPHDDVAAHLLNTLGTCFVARYERRGTASDLEDGLAAVEQALEYAVGESDLQLLTQLNVAAALLARHRMQPERSDDLDQALKLCNQVISLIASSHEYWPKVALLVAEIFQARVDRTLNPQETEEGAAVLFEPDKLADHIRTVLGTTMQALGMLSLPGDQQAVVPPSAPIYARSLARLAIGLVVQHDVEPNGDQIREALGHSRRAVELAYKTAPYYAEVVHARAVTLRSQHAVTGDDAILQESIEAYRRAATVGMESALPVALHVASEWSAWAFSRRAWREVVAAHGLLHEAASRYLEAGRQDTQAWLDRLGRHNLRAAMDLVNGMTAPSQFSTVYLSDVNETFVQIQSAYRQKNWLRATQGKYGQAAYALAQLGQDSDAVLAIEQGLLLLFDETLPSNRLVANVTAQVTMEDIGAAAQRAPLVYIAATAHGGLALIVARTSDVVTVWLPGLNTAELEKVLFGTMIGWGIILAPGMPWTRAGYLKTYYSSKASNSLSWAVDAWRTAIDETAHWLWDTVFAPLLGALPSSSHAILIPVGFINFLPLTAAWTEDTETPTGRKYALDARILTLAPCARVLLRAQSQAERHAVDSLLTVEEPRPVTAGHLSFAAPEAQLGPALFARADLLRHEDATLDAVLLNPHTLLHFVCHAYSDYEEPLNSALILAGDGRLRIADMLAQRTEKRLAILSACETAVPGRKLPDEAISLASGMMQSGIAGVIASQWAVFDISTTMLMARFFDLWRCQGYTPADALVHAQRWLRDTTDGDKRRYFRSILPEFGGDARLPAASITPLYQAVALRDPKERSYAHPHHWAGFTYTGA